MFHLIQVNDDYRIGYRNRFYVSNCYAAKTCSTVFTRQRQGMTWKMRVSGKWSLAVITREILWILFFSQNICVKMYKWAIFDHYKMSLFPSSVPQLNSMSDSYNHRKPPGTSTLFIVQICYADPNCFISDPESTSKFL